MTADTTDDRVDDDGESADLPERDDPTDPTGPTESEDGRREVVVPMRVYKAVTVFSTLIAIVGVIGGFALLDRATDRARVPLEEVDPVLAIVGLGLILGSAAVYAYGGRFRAEGMGNPKEDADEPTDNG